MIPTITLSRFVMSEQRKHPASTGELSDLLSGIALAVKLIAQLVSTSGFKGLTGYTGNTNVQGESTRILDVESDEILFDILGTSGHFGLLVSEERESVIESKEGRASAKYVVAFDPLDGSSNVGSNIPVGTIFSIFRKKSNGPASRDDFMQTGRNLVAAGYAIYGPKTTFVYSCGDGAHGFTLDPTIGEFILTDHNMKCPERGNTYSVNEGNETRWSDKVRSYIAMLKKENKQKSTPYSLRYVGSLVADFDRNLRNGGIFLYPADSKSPKGKLRLFYECIPLSFIQEQAGGRAIDGLSGNILDIVPHDIHQRTPLIIGSPMEVNEFEEWVK